MADPVVVFKRRTVGAVEGSEVAAPVATAGGENKA
jgi:hypothetical protein